MSFSNTFERTPYLRVNTEGAYSPVVQWALDCKISYTFLPLYSADKTAALLETLKGKNSNLRHAMNEAEVTLINITKQMDDMSAGRLEVFCLEKLWQIYHDAFESFNALRMEWWWRKTLKSWQLETSRRPEKRTWTGVHNIPTDMLSLDWNTVTLSQIDTDFLNPPKVESRENVRGIPMEPIRMIPQGALGFFNKENHPVDRIHYPTKKNLSSKVVYSSPKEPKLTKQRRFEEDPEVPNPSEEEKLEEVPQLKRSDTRTVAFDPNLPLQGSTPSRFVPSSYTAPNHQELADMVACLVTDENLGKLLYDTIKDVKLEEGVSTEKLDGSKKSSSN